MANTKYQFNQTVRIVPRGGKPKIFAAGSVQTIEDHEILKHPHFKKFLAAKMVVPFVPKEVKKLQPVMPDKKAKKPGELAGLGGQLKKNADAKAKAAATSVSPETEVGSDGEEASDEASDEQDKPAKKGKGSK
jgi:hypothetical protein